MFRITYTLHGESRSRLGSYASVSALQKFLRERHRVVARIERPRTHYPAEGSIHNAGTRAECQHCGRAITRTGGAWVDGSISRDCTDDKEAAA